MGVNFLEKFHKYGYYDTLSIIIKIIKNKKFRKVVNIEGKAVVRIVVNKIIFK